jgi:hypothetical protein
VYVWLGDESGVDVGFFSCVCANFDDGLMMLGVRFFLYSKKLY